MDGVQLLSVKLEQLAVAVLQWLDVSCLYRMANIWSCHRGEFFVTAFFRGG